MMNNSTSPIHLLEEENIMNRKLFCLMMIVVAVLVALAITVPALAETPLHYEDNYAFLDCDGDGIDEIWADIWGSYFTRYILDENGVEVEVFWHGTDHWHLYNYDHPDLFIDGTSVVNHHSQKIDGSWFTGSEFNFHAPGYPQLNHTSGYFWWDDNDVLIYEHGRFVIGDIQQFCELLTPP
jgi:hypothetical protein